MNLGPVYPILDLDSCDRTKIDPLDLLCMWAELGLPCCQLRAKGLSPGRYEDWAESLKGGLRHRGNGKVAFIGNDFVHPILTRPDLFVGLHLGQEDLAQIQSAEPDLVRILLDNQKRLGISTHSVDQLQRALALFPELGYAAIGPLFPTSSKPSGRDPVLLESDREQVFAWWSSRRMSLSTNLVVIGGINSARYAGLFTTGFRETSGFQPVPAVIQAAVNRTELERLIGCAGRITT